MLNSQRIKSKAKLVGLSMREISNKLGRQEFYMYDVMKGRCKISQADLEKLAEILETTVDYLNGDTDVSGVVRDTEEFVDIYRLVNNRPSTKLLFSALKGATDEDIKQTIAILEALKRTNGQQ